MYLSPLIRLLRETEVGYGEKYRVVHIMLNVSHYYANSLCSTNATIMLK